LKEDGTSLPAAELPFALALHTGEPQSGVVVGLQKPGEEITWLLMNSVPLFRPNERTLYRVMTTFINISQRKRLEDQLRQSRIAEQQANELKSQFLANASHEIRTPLNGILGLSELLSETSLTAEQKDLNDSIIDSGRSLLRIINDILDLSKIEAGKLSLSPRKLDFPSCVSRLVRPFEFAAKTKGIEFSVTMDSAPALVMCDDVRLGQILSNVIGNAIKFTEQGGVSLRVQVLRSTSSNQFVRFEVKDTGIGIGYETAHRLFQPFAQGNRVSGGTGLGLSIAQRLTELMGGVINFVSAPGQGSTFWIDLGFPLVQADGVTLAIPEDSGVATLPRLTGAVLVVEDNLVNQKLIGRILEKVGCSYQMALNGADALKMLRSQRFDLVLMDCMMPVMDGYEATRLIREGIVPHAASIPIIALTANVIEGAPQLCKEHGMNEFVPKPLDREMLIGALKKYLRVAETRQPSPEAMDLG
ncbi:MAG: response regulator, partial [Proteobacteria bacterium]|nr:response regulator [Pseudomonadota bacterium]